MKKPIYVALLLSMGIFINGECASSQLKESQNFGVDGFDLRILSDITELGDGISGVNGVKWGMLEPKPPLNEHTYSWERLDRGVAKFRQVGRTIQLNLLFGNNWAMDFSDNTTGIDPTIGKKVKKFTRVKPVYLDAWGELVFTLANRYPEIKYLQVGSEEENAWEDAEGYVQALCVAYKAAKKADPGIKIMAAGFNVGDFFALSEKEQAAYIGKSSISRKFKFIENVVAQGGQCFDILSIHLSGREKSIPATVKWYQDMMRTSGYAKPVWSDDTASGPGVGGTKPLPGEEKMFSLLNTGKLKSDRDAFLKFLRLQSIFIVKKSVVAFTSGVSRVFISSDSDFHNYYMPQWRHMGLIDYRTKKKKPAFYAYKQLISKIDGFVKAEEIDDCVYRFTFNDKGPVYVAWADSGGRIIDLSEHIPAPNVRLTRTPVDLKSIKQNLAPEVIPTTRIRLGESPIFIEEDENQ